MNGTKPSTSCLALLSHALWGGARRTSLNLAAGADPEGDPTGPLAGLTDFRELWTLATSHHVIVRAFPVLQRVLESSGSERATGMEEALGKERARAQHALSFLSPICESLHEAGDVVVIKSLDHWPDLGSDLDLYTNAGADEVVAIMRQRFKAQVAERSWGDRLADKWNFIVPGLPELVEIHVARLGQTGEQIAMTESLTTRSGPEQFGSHTLPVPAAEDRIMISTLQRMYRHFYIRLCDIADNAKLVDSGKIDYLYLKSLARKAGVWDGVATYLVIISEYVKSYRGEGLDLPALVTDAARFGNELVRFKRNFLRIPIFPQAMSLYVAEWKKLLLNGELQSTLRLSLLPALATAAALELKMTGSDKGIW